MKHSTLSYNFQLYLSTVDCRAYNIELHTLNIVRVTTQKWVQHWTFEFTTEHRSWDYNLLIGLTNGKIRSTTWSSFVIWRSIILQPLCAFAPMSILVSCNLECWVLWNRDKIRQKLWDVGRWYDVSEKSLAIHFHMLLFFYLQSHKYWLTKAHGSQ